MALGHEIAGTIAEVGPDVAHPTSETPVAVNPSRACGRCVYCQAGMQNECLHMHFIAFIGRAMRMPYHQGGFRRSPTVEATQAVPIEAAMAKPLDVCLYASGVAGPLIGKRVLITGAGPIGPSFVSLQAIAVTSYYSRPDGLELRCGGLPDHRA